MSPFDVAFDLDLIDPLAAALTDGGSSGEMLVERRGGGLHATSLRWWLRQAGEPAPVDFDTLELITQGPVLDIGCATGRHLEALGDAGLEAEGIDINPAPVAQARRHGCVAHCADFWTFRPARRYRWLVALGNNLGIAGRLADLPQFLRRLAELLVPGGQVLLSSVDAPGFGEMRLRLHYADRRGPWFDWLYVSPDTLAAHAREAGFTYRLVRRFDEVYVAVLTRPNA
jgi:SAM-dependent methyltransferase